MWRSPSGKVDLGDVERGETKILREELSRDLRGSIFEKTLDKARV